MAEWPRFFCEAYAMELGPEQADALAEYPGYYRPLIGDSRTAKAFRGTVKGMIAAESLVCARAAAHSPALLDSGFYDIAEWGTTWATEQQLACRLCHVDRLVNQQNASGAWQRVSSEQAG